MQAFEIITTHYSKSRRVHVPSLHSSRHHQHGAGQPVAGSRLTVPAAILFSACAGGDLICPHREQGQVLALLALTCRVAEAIQYGESAIYFAVGSLLFAWLLLRGRLIPAVLAQLGVLASALLVLVLPAQLAGLFGGPMSWASSITWLVWLPMLIFEVVFSLWLMIKGIRIKQ